MKALILLLHLKIVSGSLNGETIKFGMYSCHENVLQNLKDTLKDFEVGPAPAANQYLVQNKSAAYIVTKIDQGGQFMCLVQDLKELAFNPSKKFSAKSNIIKDDHTFSPSLEMTYQIGKYATSSLSGTSRLSPTVVNKFVKDRLLSEGYKSSKSETEEQSQSNDELRTWVKNDGVVGFKITKLNDQHTEVTIYETKATQSSAHQ